ncbi:DUF4367 domain-containing protein [Oceanobacillus luteolus]|uniref:DUF6612 family protein n=1 Tax=Oceanobacillus luteolus TaxID=1274358 RepID=A0ABW4HWS8_9BACI|nr:DUF6612 family protein [Oceanobacillus luteolus]MCM3741617.1 DUF4367 domain-containing protein [Oceanobacillus luteolus]
MKKSIALLMMAVLLLLAACGGEAKTAGEVMEESIKATEELESYSADMKVDTEVMGMDMNIEAVSDITHNPDTLYMDMSMGMTGFTMDVEVYVVGEEAYMKMFGEWVMMDAEEIVGLEGFDQLNQTELEKLNDFIDHFEMTEEDGMYVLTLTGEGEEFQTLIDTYLEASMGDLAMDPSIEEDLYTDLVVNSLKMELKIDKKSMIIQEQSVDADLSLDGESYAIKADTIISNVNEVEPVAIPDEVKDNAVTEDSLLDFGFTEESLPLEEIREIVDYTVPEATFVPEGFELTDSSYYEDEMIEMVYLSYDKDGDNYFGLTVYPSKEAYVEAFGEVYEDESTETISINGSEGVLEVLDESFLFLTWEHEDGAFLELISEGTDITREILMEIAEGIQ